MIILDACAIIAYLRGEEGADTVISALSSGRCCAHAANMSEVYKDCLQRDETKEIADQFLNELKLCGLEIREDMDELFWKDIAVCKAKIRKISFADCFALSTTRRFSGTLYTSDHEFDKVADCGLCKVQFIR